jgi:hypothetical protein
VPIPIAAERGELASRPQQPIAEALQKLRTRKRNNMSKRRACTPANKLADLKRRQNRMNLQPPRTTETTPPDTARRTSEPLIRRGSGPDTATSRRAFERGDDLRFAESAQRLAAQTQSLTDWQAPTRTSRRAGRRRRVGGAAVGSESEARVLRELDEVHASGGLGPAPGTPGRASEDSESR